jgi:hypothetical protein
MDGLDRIIAYRTFRSSGSSDDKISPTTSPRLLGVDGRNWIAGVEVRESCEK